MSPAPSNRSPFRWSIALSLAGILLLVPRPAAPETSLPHVVPNPAGPLDQILRENAVFFSILITFSFTAAVADPEWGVDVSDINLNLITREVRDAQGRQLIRVRVAGVVRKNNNVELNLLNLKGELVGKAFFGYDSGQLTFFDPNDKPIVDGYMDSQGNFSLDDLRLPVGERALAEGFVDPCFDCGSLDYSWYDGLNYQVGGGRIYPTFYYDEYSVDRARMYWTFLQGKISDSVAATGEAEYDLDGEATGAINSALFDQDRSAESFFADPRSLVPEHTGRALLPRVTDDTGIAVTNASGRETRITYAARLPDGSLITGEGIRNPITYIFAPGQQFAAYPAEIFRGLNGVDRRAILGDADVAWVEIYSDEGDIQAMYLDGNREGSGLDGNVGVRIGGNPVVFPDLHLKPDESMEIELLNLAYESSMLRLQLLDREGTILREESQFYIAGCGMRNFYIGGSSDLLRVGDPSLAASLRISCDNSGSSSGCSKVVGLATYRDPFGSIASALAVSEESAGTALIGPHFVTGASAGGKWETTVRVAKFSGGSASVYLDLYDADGSLLITLSRQIALGGQADFDLGGATLPWGDRLTSGYLRLRSDSGLIAGDVSLRWSDGNGSQLSKYPLSNYLYSTMQFNQVAEGSSGGPEYWTGIAFVNDLDRQVRVAVQIFRSDGTEDRSAEIVLNPFEQYVSLIPQLLKDPLYTRIGGYLRVTSTNPISAVVLYGDSSGRFLAAVPGIGR